MPIWKDVDGLGEIGKYDHKNDPAGKRKWQKLQRLKEYQTHFGSRYPPMILEPFTTERQRLSSPGMNAQDRFMRKQYLEDIQLKHGEPKMVPQAWPRNVFRRAWNWPWDKLFELFRPVMRDPWLSLARYKTPKIVLFYGFILLLYYNIKYGQITWDFMTGPRVFMTRAARYKGDKPLAEKETDDFFDIGFKARKTHLDIHNCTSSTSPINDVDYPEPHKTFLDRWFVDEQAGSS